MSKKLTGKVKTNARKKKTLDSKKKYEFYKRSLLSQIKKFGDPVLKKECLIVENGEDTSTIAKHIKKILGVTITGVGIAACQIGYLKQIVALRPKGPGGEISILINPEIIKTSEEKVKSIEGCLSYPKVEARTERYKEVTVRYVNEDGKEEEKGFKGFESIIVQHELDHLKGTCIVGDEWLKSRNQIDKK